MDDLQVPTDEYSYGRSKIFIRNPRTVNRTKSKCFLFLCLVWLQLTWGPVCPAALCVSHSQMFAKQGGLHIQPPPQQLAFNHH